MLVRGAKVSAVAYHLMQERCLSVGYLVLVEVGRPKARKLGYLYRDAGDLLKSNVREVKFKRETKTPQSDSPRLHRSTCRWAWQVVAWSWLVKYQAWQ
jgi:hypothetical protein